jgi:glycosyltransferase involved in cell wall biosynthesis
MPTLNRTEEVGNFIDKLVIQTHKDFELLVIDQNRDETIRDMCYKYKNRLDIKYFHSGQKGLSLNRNIGLEHCGGDIIAFPDDDCEYSEDTLEKAASFFAKNPSFDFYTCNVKDKTGRNSILDANRLDAEITLDNFMVTGISFTIFVRAGSIASFRFDEQMGLGARFGSAEESDLILYLIKNNNRGFYHANTCIYHPNSQRSVNSLFSYGKGFGALHKKAIITYHFYGLLPRFLLVLLKEAVKLCFLSPRTERWAVMKGRILGFVHYEKNPD